MKHFATTRFAAPEGGIDLIHLSAPFVSLTGSGKAVSGLADERSISQHHLDAVIYYHMSPVSLFPTEQRRDLSAPKLCLTAQGDQRDQRLFGARARLLARGGTHNSVDRASGPQ